MPDHNTDTLIVAVVDESGSMSPFIEATIKGFDDLIREQSAIPGGRLTLTTFGGSAFTHQVGSDLHAFLGQGGLRSFYTIRGNTPLLDAVGNAIKASEDWVKNTSFTGRVMVVVLTDGEENASRTWHMNQPPKDGDDHDLGWLIQHKQGVDKWEFVFLGSGGSEWLEKTFGAYVERDRFYGTRHTYAGTMDTYGGVSQAMASSRVTGQSFGSGDIDTSGAPAPDVVQPDATSATTPSPRADDETKGPVH